MSATALNRRTGEAIERTTERGHIAVLRGGGVVMIMVTPALYERMAAALAEQEERQKKR